MKQGRKSAAHRRSPRRKSKAKSGRRARRTALTRLTVVDPQVFRKLLSICRRIGKLAGGSDALSVVMRELEAVDVVWNRFIANRDRLLLVAPRVVRLVDQGRINSVEHRRASEEERRLLLELAVDMRSIFVFGDILLTKCMMLVEAVDNRGGATDGDFTAFLKKMRRGSTPESVASRIYQANPTLAWRLENLLGFYSGKFITHPLKPYSEGVVVGVNHSRFQLVHQVHSPASGQIDQFRNQLPTRIRDNLARCAAPLEQAGFLMTHLSECPEDLRKKVECFIREVGVLTPDIYHVTRELASMCETILSEVETPKLGHRVMM